LGKALALALACRGARLVLVARGKEELETVVENIRKQGGEAEAWVADLGDKETIYPLAGMAHATLGTVDLVIHNASALGPSPLRPLLDTDCEDLERALAVNVIGPFRLTKALAGAMALAGRGVVVHVTSDASVSAYPGWGAYSVSKAALDHLTRLWAVELDDLGLRVVSVDPGDMNTDLHREAVPDDEPASLLDPEEVAERFVAWLEQIETLPNGSRTALSEWRKPRWTFGERIQVEMRA
jgi:NAD(P)-dependent dehydrogenase (short-subunit alcohol dehydrogenase family)